MNAQGRLFHQFDSEKINHFSSEYKPLEEISQFISSLQENYEKQLKQTNEKKEALFKINDFKLWGFTQGSVKDMMKHRESLMFDKESAFKFMCSLESQKLHEMKEEICFY